MNGDLGAAITRTRRENSAVRKLPLNGPPSSVIRMMKQKIQLEVAEQSKCITSLPKGEGSTLLGRRRNG